MTKTCTALLAIFIATAVLISVVPSALADDAAKTKKEADRHFKTGVKLFDESKYAEALAEFEQAYALKPHPLVLYNLAASHRALSQYDQAVDFYNRFLDEGADTVDRRRLRRGKRELKQVLALVGRVTVSTTPEGAKVTIDGRDVGTSPFDEALILGPGDHVVAASLEGYEDTERKLRLASGDTIEVAFSLAKQAEETKEPDGGAEADANSEIDSKAPSLTDPPRLRRFGVSAAFATDALQTDVTGAPVVGLGFAINDRFSVGVDAVLVAYSAIPEVRVRLFGDVFSAHVIAALPISFKDGDDSETFVAGAGGLGVRYRPLPMIAFRAEAWVSYAGSKHGTTVPAFGAAELWF